jgi:hypothetical protein
MLIFSSGDEGTYRLTINRRSGRRAANRRASIA